MYKKTAVIFIFVFLSVSFAIKAQNRFHDVVYLKNGSVIHGLIIEQVPNQSIKIETSEKNIFVFTMDQIQKITKEFDEKDDIKETRQPLDLKKKSHTGYSFIMQTHVGYGVDDDNQNGVSLATHFINGVMIDNRFSAGIGVGFDYTTLGYQPYNESYYYDYSRVYLSTMYFLDVRAFPLKQKVSPILIFNYGYSTTMFSSYVRGKSFFSAGIGTRFNFTEKIGLSLSLHYKQQNFTYYKEDVYVYPYGYTDITENFTLRYAVLTIGLSL